MTPRICLFVLCTSAMVAFAAKAADKGVVPQEVVTEIVLNHNNSDSKMFICPPSALMKARFTKSYVSIWRDECDISHEGESGNLLLYGQGLIDISLDSMTSRQSKNSAKVLAKISYVEGNVLDNPRSLAYVLFSLKKENATWKVDEHKLVDAHQIDSK